MSNAVTVCIFEDNPFNAKDIPGVLGFDARRVRNQRGWTFNLHPSFCPENEVLNPSRVLLRTPEKYNHALKFVSEIAGYGCLFFDCQFLNEDNENKPLTLTDEQKSELTSLGVGTTDMEISQDAQAGLYLALRAAKNESWQGAIVIASSASGHSYYIAFADKLQAKAKNKIVRSLERKLTHNYNNVGALRAQFDEGIDYFLMAVGVGKPGRERLHPLGTESWFDDDNNIAHGHPPHSSNVFAALPANSPARKSLNCYLARLLGCTESEAALWTSGAHQELLHSALKHCLGACASVHAAKHSPRRPNLFTVLMGVSACCPHPFSWMKTVCVDVTNEIFNSDITSADAQKLLYGWIAEGGLFQKLFTWDRTCCQQHNKYEPVIIEASIPSRSLVKIKLHRDFNVASLVVSTHQTKRCLDDINSRLKVDGHPLSITLSEADNAILFQV